ncbi:hypothetical protein MPLB_490003 [Mesorhizobium sp. ORS 3324]|nr:hypothetical protein MPLB_490003 [Mesorhizobium sp. ORS 3324]
MRFVAIQDPTGSWAVFDTANEEPAEFGGRVLIGLTPHEARWLTAAANDEAGWQKTGALGTHPGQ